MLCCVNCQPFGLSASRAYPSTHRAARKAIAEGPSGTQRETCMCLSAQVCACVHRQCSCDHIWSCVCMSTHKFMSAFTCVTHVRAHPRVCRHNHKCTHVHTYRCTDIHAHTHMDAETTAHPQGLPLGVHLPAPALPCSAYHHTGSTDSERILELGSSYNSSRVPSCASTWSK